MSTNPIGGGQIGRSVPRLEARDKVTGRAEYTHLMRLPGMLHGKIFRSTVAHGRIKSIDTSAAKKIPGVYRVITADDVRKVIPDPYYGPAFHDQPILAIDKVRFVGEPVAVVLAADPHVAEAATQEIVAEYEELPAVYDEVEAMTSPVYVHDELKPAGTFADLKHLKGQQEHQSRARRQVAARRHRQGLRRSARTCSSTHSARRNACTSRSSRSPRSPTPRNRASRSTPARRGPRSCAPRSRGCSAGRKTACASRCRISAAAMARKLYIKLEALVTACSLIVRRPVKIALTMEEQFYQITKHPSTFRIKTGLDKDGRITARKCEVFWNGGAYADVGPRVTHKSGFTASGPYDIDNVWINSYALYTNMTPAGALRGFGMPQLAWAYESQIDMMARALKLDAVEFRRKNLLRDGRPQATGTILKDAPLEAILDHVADRLRWKEPFDRGSGTIKRGRGLAIALKAAISPTASVAILNVGADGSAILYISTVDMGQGSDTAHGADRRRGAQHAGGDPCKVVARDTDVTPYDMGTLGSRSLFHMGHAVRLAAEEARDKIAALRTRSRRAGRQQHAGRRPVHAKNTACRPATSSAPAATSRTTSRPTTTPACRRT